MTDYTMISPFRNKNQVEYLIKKLNEKEKSCYNFCEMPANPDRPFDPPEEQMKVFESVENFLNNDYFKRIFNRDLKGIKNAKEVIILMPAGLSTHMELGVAYGLGKKCIMIGKPVKPETLYLMCDRFFDSIESFLESI